MSMEESRARLNASRTVPEYFWFEGSDLKDFFEDAERLGVKNVQVRIYPGLDENGFPDLHIKVVTESATESCGDALNCSHVCPPDCGGD